MISSVNCNLCGNPEGSFACYARHGGQRNAKLDFHELKSEIISLKKEITDLKARKVRLPSLRSNSELEINAYHYDCGVLDAARKIREAGIEVEES